MYLEQSQFPSHQQSLTISAKLIASIKVLQYSSEELEQAIAQELRENPALELDESMQCPHCGAVLAGGVCSTCERLRDGDTAGDGGDGLNDGRNELATWDDLAPDLHDARNLATTADDDRYDPLDFVHTSASLHETLLRQLGAMLDDEHYRIAEYLIGSLDSHGYVTVAIAEAAEALRVSEEHVTQALALLQTLDPPGIGARDVRECLLIQLRAFEEHGAAPPLTHTLVDHYLRELGAHHFVEIAHALGATSAQVKAAWQFIKVNLNPYPAHAFEVDGAGGLGLASDNTISAVVRPDVVIRRTLQGFEAEVVEQRRYRFAMNPLYHSLYQEGRAHRIAPAALGDAGRQHVRQYVTRTRFFIDCMRQRWETLNAIANALIEFQYNFLDKGARHLRPLTRGELAAHIGLHESTVSRATANKYVLLPEGRVVPFDDFFDGSLAAKDILRELIAAENPQKPFSDEDLTGLLNERGLLLARRTVAKYREVLGILPSRLRI
ncbi:MAG: RNA polymerase factor sigma-54 [Ktedonobacterales bacterium]